ncbi:MAG: PKD-like domain-containing protein [Flavobacteriaceae bacterium]
MNKNNLFRILLLSSFFAIFFSGFANNINGGKTNTESYVLNSASRVVPTISSQSPSTLDICVGEPISLFVNATGNGSLSYQWQKDGVDIAGETTDNLNIAVSVASDAGEYQCVITDVDGTTTSATTIVSVRNLPSISVSGDLIICEGQTTTLTAIGALNYDWGNGFTNQASFDVSPLVSSIFTVTGQDSAGCTASASVLVEVSPIPTASVTSNGPVCSGSDAQFIFSGDPDAVVTYKLNSGADTNITLSNSGTFSVTIPNVSSDQTISLVEVNNTNCGTFLSTSETVIVEPIPSQPSVVSSVSYCQGDITSALTASGTDLKWYLAPTSGSPLSQVPVPDSSNTGTFSYYVSQTINGCESLRAEIQVQVNPIPVISISGDNTICLGETTVLTAAGGNSYVWSPGGETTPSITVSPTSNTTYSVIGTDADGCSDSATFSVIVNAVPTASVSASTPICEGEDANFTITGSPNATVVYSIDSAANQTVVLDAAGLATISEANQLTDIAMSLISVNNSDCSSPLTDSVTITVNPIASAPVVTSPIEYCLNETSSPLTSTFDTGNSEVWYNFDGTQLSSAPTPDTSSSGTVTYEVSQTNAFGCESPRSQITVIVKPLPFAPTVGSPVVNLCLNEVTSPLDTSGISNPRWYDASTSGNFLGNSYTPLTNSVGTTNFYVSETINNCEGPRTQVQVNINPVPVAPSVASSSVFYCKNSTADPLTATPSTGGSLNWYLVATGGVGSANPPIIDTSAVGTNTYYVSETNNLGCESSRTAITVTIDDIPSVPSIGTLTNPTCLVSTGSVELSNLPPGTWTITNVTDGTTYSDSSSTYTVSGLITGTYSFVVSNGTCESEATSPVTINSVPVQSPPVVGTLVQPSCTVSTGSATLTGLPSSGNWTLTRVSDNVSFTNSGTSTVISGLPTGIHNYTVTNSDGCVSEASLNIVIDAQPSVPNAPIANAQSFLESDSATISDLQISSSGTPVWYNQAVSGTQYASTFTLVTGDYFAAQIDTSGCESVNRTTVSVTIFPTSVGGSVSGTTTVCSGTNSTVLTLSGHTGSIIRWESSPVVDFSSGVIAISNVSTTYTVTNTTSDLYYRAVLQSGSAPEEFSTPAFVQVSQPSNGGVLTATNSSICENNVGGVISLASEVGTIIQWQESTDNGASWSTISNTTNSYSVPVLTQTTIFRAEVQNGSCASAFSNEVEIVVNPAPSITDIPNQLFCLGDSATFGEAFIANYSYAWYSNLSVNPSVPIDNSNQITLNFNQVNTQIFTYRITNDTTGCFVEDTFEIVTDPLPVAQVISDTTICEFESINVGAASVLGHTYSWSSIPVGFTSTSSNPLVTPTVTTTYILTETTPNGCTESNQVVVTVQPEPVITITDGPSFDVCETPSNPIQLQSTVINYEPSSIVWSNQVGSGDFSDPNILNPTYTPSAADIINSFVILDLTVTGLGPCAQTYTDNITINIDAFPSANAGNDVITCGTDPVTLDASGTLNASSLVWTLPSGITGTLNLSDPERPVFTPSLADLNYVGPITLNLEAISGNTCLSDTDSVDILITQPPVVDIAPIDATICEGSNYTFSAGSVTVTDGVSSSYAWSNGTGDGVFTSSSSLTPTYIPGPNDIFSGTVTLTLEATGESPCFTPASDDLILNIVKEPIVDAGADSLACEGPINIAGASIENAGSILWTVDPATGNGFFIDPTVENPIYVPASTDLNSTVTLIVSVSPINGCGPDISDSVLYTINAAPTAVAGGDATICETNNAYQLQSTIANSNSITWISTGTGSFDNVNTEDPIYTFSPNDKISGSVSFTVTASQAGCANASDTMVVTIQKNPIANAGTTSEICEGESVTISNATSQFESAINWTQSGGLGTFTNTSTLAPTYNSVPGESGTVILTLTADAISPCTIPSTSQTEIVITPKPFVNAGDDAQICEGESFTISTATNINTAGLIWSTSGNGTFQPGSEFTLTPTYIPGSFDTNSGSVTLTLTGQENFPCNSAAMDSMVLTINKIPTIDIIIPVVDLCVDTPNFPITNVVIDHYDSLLWETSGTGNFGGLETTEAPTYFPTPADYELGIVTLTLTASRNPLNCNSSTEDTITLNFIEKPTVDAGPPNVSLCEGALAPSSYVTNQATADPYSTLTWSSSGTGTWSTPNPNNLLETYTPSPADYDTGFVILTLEVNSVAPCTDLVTDTIQLDLQKLPVITVPPTTSICIDQNTFGIGGVSIAPATAYDPNSIVWETTGTGVFTTSGDPLNPIYNPSNADLADGIVTLTITVDSVAPCAIEVTESFDLLFQVLPVADAGVDLTECDLPFQITTASFDTTTVNNLVWSNGSGDGTFDLDNIISPIYTPGTGDLAIGSVTLTLTATALDPCTADEVTSMVVTFVDSPTVVVVTPQNPICEDETNVAVVGTTIDDADSFIWTSTTGTGTTIANPTTLNPLVTPSATDIINEFIDLTLTVTPNAPCSTPIEEVVRIPVQKNPSLFPGVSQNICEGAIISTFDATETNVTNLVWSNNGGDGTFTASINNITTEYTPGPNEIANGLVELVVTADAIAPCVGTISELITHTITRDPVVTLTTNEDTICESQGSYTIPTGTVSIENVSSVDTFGWTSSGSGTLLGANTLTPSYEPSSADIGTGFVNLIFTLNPTAPCSTQIIETFKLNIDPLATIDFTDDGFFCEGIDKPLTATFTNHDPSTINWTIVSGTGTLTDGNTASPTYEPGADSDTVVIQISVDGISPCDEPTTQQFTMNVIETPVVSMTTLTDTVCSSQLTYNLTGNSVEDPTNTLSWTRVSPVGTGTFSNPTDLNPSYTFNQADIDNGSVTLRLTATSNAPCSSTDFEEITIIIDQAPNATISSLGAVCAGEPYTATAFNPDGNTVSWTEINGSHGTFVNSNLETATFNQFPGNEDDFEIQLTSTTTATCAPFVQTITVVVQPKPTIDVGNSIQEVCSSEPFVISGVTATDYASVLWTVDGTGSSAGFSNPTDLNPTFTPSASQLLASQVVLKVTALAEAECGTAFDVSDTITLNFNPEQTVSFTAPTSICEGDTISLVGLAPDSSSILWSTSSTTSTSDFADPTNLNTIYTPSALDVNLERVTLTITGFSNTNCPDATYSLEVLIEKNPTADAGGPISICEGTTSYQVNDAFASNYDASVSTNINWSLTGPATIQAGTQNDLNPVILPTAGATGDIILTLTVNGYDSCNTTITDTKTISVVPSPIVVVPSTRTICEGESLTLSNSEISASNYSSVVWTSSNGLGTFTPNNDLATIYTPAAGQTGIVNLILTASSTSGSCSSDSSPIQLEIIPNPIVDAGVDATICVTETYTVVGASVLNEFTYTWSVTGPAQIVSGESTLTPVIASDAGATGTAVVTLTAVGTGVCPVSITDSFNIEINASPVVNAGNDDILCEGESSYQLLGSVVDADASTTYSWITSNGSGIIQPTADPLQPIYIPGPTDFNSATGSKDIQFDLTSTSTNGCASSTDSMVLTIYANPIVSAGPDIFDICEDTDVILSSATASNYSSITWSTSGNGTFDFSSSLINPIYSLGSDDTTSVTLTLSAMPNVACSQVAVLDEMTIFINQDTTLSATTNTITMCGATFTMPDLIDVSNATSILWTNITGASGTPGVLTNVNSETPSFTPSVNEIANGFVLLRVETVPEAGCTTTLSETITVNLQPLLEVEAGTSLAFCEGDDVIVSGNGASVTNFSTYTWSHNGIGSIDPSTINTLNPKYIPGISETGDIILTLTATSIAPCTGDVSDTMTVTIQSQPTVTVAADFTVCESSNINIVNTTATDANTIIWTSSQNSDGSSSGGYVSGIFTNDAILNPSYTPSQDDIDLGYVYLTIRVSNTACGTFVTDVIQVTIADGVGVFAGVNASICESETYTLLDATSSATDVTWISSENSNGTSSGTYLPGSFSDATALNPEYIPSIDDINRGYVYLTITGTGNSSCPVSSSSMLLNILKNPTVSANDINTCVSNSTGVPLNGTGTNYDTLTWSVIEGPGQVINDVYFSYLGTDIPSNVVTRLRLVATPLSPCAENAIQEIIVITQALPSVEAGDNGAICYIPGTAIAPFTILGTNVSNASSTSWTTSGSLSGNFNLGNPVVYESFSNSCTPEVLTLTANGVGACSSESVSDSVTLTINCTIPNLGAITGLDTVCQGNSGVVYTVPVNSNVITYEWQVPTGATIVSGQGTNSISVDYGANAVSGNVSVNGVNGCGSGPNSTLPITIDELPTTGIVSGEQTVCAGSTYVYTTTTISNALSYLWTLPDGSTISTTTNTISIAFAASATSGNLSVQGNNSCGLGASSAALPITVQSQPTLTSTLTPPSICSDETFEYVPTSALASTTYSWTRAVISGISNTAGSGTGIISEVLTNTSSVTIPVNYIITLTSEDGCSDSETITVDVDPNPILTSATPVAAICSGDQFNHTLTSNVTGSINWTRASVTGITEPGSSGVDTISEVLTNVTTAPITVVYSALLPANSAGCTGDPITFDVVVNPEPNVDQPVSQILCVGEILDVDFVTTNTGGVSGFTWTNDNSSIGLPLTGSGDISAVTVINTSPVSQVATLVVTPTFDNEGISCTGPTKTFTITINPAAQVNPISSEVVCNGDSFTPIAFSTSNTSGTTTYSWTNDNTSIGLAPTGSTDIAAFTATNITTIPQVATIVVTPTYTFNGQVCSGSPETFQLTVNPSAQVNQPTSQILCEGELVSNIDFDTLNTGGTTTYDWTNDNVTIGLSASSGSGDISSFTALNSTGIPQVANIIVTPTFTNGSVTCTGASKSFTITVNPSAQVDPIASQIVCAGDSTTDINFFTTNTIGTTTYSWTNNNTTIGSLPATGTGNIASFTATNSSTIPQVATIIVTPEFTYNGISCLGVPETFQITVNPSAEVNQPSDEVFCESDVAVINFTTPNTVGTTTYNWTNSNSAIGLLSSSGSGSTISFTTTNTGTTPITSTLIVTPTFSYNGVDCDGPNKIFTITVNPNPNMISPSSQILCDGDTTTVDFTTSNSVGTTTYAWTNNTPSIGIPASGVGSIPAFSVVNTGNAPITASLTVTPTFTNEGVSCVGSTENFTITVNPSAQVNQPVSVVVCDGDTVAATSFSSSNTVGTTTYTWTNDNLSTGLNISSGTGDVPTFIATNTGTDPLVSTVTVTPSFDNAGVICSGPSKTYTVTVNPVAQVNPPASQVVCNGDSTNVSFTTANTVGLTTYSWTNSDTSIGLAASGTGNIPTFITSNLNPNPVISTITVTPTFINGGVSCSGPSETFTITVSPSGQVDQPASQIVCNGDSTTPVNFTTSNTTGTTTFSWTNSNPSIGLAASGTGTLPSFVASNSSNTVAVGTIVVTPFYDYGGVSCQGVSKTFTIEVNPEPEMIQPDAQVICDGDTFFYNFDSNNLGGTTTYEWSNNNSSIGLITGPSTGNIPSFTATNSGLVPSVATIQVTPTYTNGGVSCVGSTLTFTITVNPSASVVLPPNQTVCNSDSTTSVNFSSVNSSGSTTYEWTNNNPGIGLGASGTGNIPSFVAINSGNIPVVASIEVTPIYNNAGVSCSGPSQTFTITVNPTAELTTPISQVLCNGENTNLVSFSSNNLGGITTYSWVNNNTTIGLAANGSGDIPSFTAINTGFTPIVATITVTPTYTNDSVSCQGPSEIVTITVNPSAHVIQPADQTLCAGNLSTEVNFNSLNTLGATTYTWTNDNTSTGLGSSGTGSILPFTTLNTGPSPNVSTITVTPVYTNGGVVCNGASKTFLITVNPILDLVQPADQLICNGQVLSPVSFISNNTGVSVTYSWTNDNTSIGLAPNGSGALPSFTAVNTGSTQQIATISVTAAYTNAGETCSSTEVFTITVNPSPVATITGLNNFLVCENDTAPFITFEGSNGVAPYTFTYQINSDPIQQVTSSGTSNSATVSISTANSGSNVITLLSVSDSSVPTACESTDIILPNEAFVDVQEQGTIIPQDSSTVSQVLCEDTALTPIVYDIGGSATSAFVTGLPSGLVSVFDSTVNTLTISGVPTSTGTFNYVVNTAGSTNGCNSSYSGSIVVNSNDEITELTPTTIDQEVCSCDTIAPISYNLGGGATGGDVQFSPNMPAGITWSISSNILTISGASCDIGTFDYTVNSFGICSSDTFGGTIVIKENSTITLVSGNPDPIVCEGSAFATPIQYAISPTTSTLVMTPTIPGVTFDPTTGIISGVPTLSGVYNYTISSSEGCSNILSGVITVNPDQDISFISTNPTQTACQNSPIDPVVFLVSPGVNDVTITPSLPVGVSYSVTSGIVTISGTPVNAMGVAQNYIVTTVGSCGIAESETFVLDVRQEATITVTSDVSTINQAICQSGSIEPITFTIGGGATGIEPLNLPDNLVLDFDAGTGVYTVSGTPVTFGTFNFNVVTTGCVATQLFSITNINTNVSIDLTSAVGTDDQQLCQSNFNTPITPIVYALTGVTGVTVTGLPVGLSSNYNNATGELVISGIPIESGEFNYAITTLPCERVKTGVIKVSTPIAFFDEQVTQVSCYGENDGAISIDIRGGASAGGLYAITWTGPNGYQQNQATITGLEPGVYTISGTDLLGCAIPTRSYVIADVDPVEISLISTSNVTCNGNLGCANFDFTGGTGIYTNFSLEFLDPSSETLTPITVANNNYFNICDLQAGLYYLTIEDSNSCTSVPYLFTIFDYSSLNIEYVELDDSLCADTPGNIRIKVASLDPSLTFYYNDVLVPHIDLGDSTYELAINNPTAPTAVLKVKNDQDCWNSINISTPIESPGFEYTSLNFATYNSVDVNESIEFTNTVDLNDIPAEYDYIVWDFGDNSPFKVFFNPEDLVPNSEGDSFKTVFHSYTIDGIYTVTLTVFNRLGCSRSVSQIITVGRGANIMTPTAFSPNNDGINDLFRASLIGFTKVSMFVYDNWGNVVYEINSDVDALDSNWGWNGLEKGNDEPINGNYKYYVIATTIDGKVVEKTGQLMLIK